MDVCFDAAHFGEGERGHHRDSKRSWAVGNHCGPRCGCELRKIVRNANHVLRFDAALIAVNGNGLVMCPFIGKLGLVVRARESHCFSIVPAGGIRTVWSGGPAGRCAAP
jgi:hypothetical protein